MEFTHEYERILNGVIDDQIEEKARKALESKKKKKEATPVKSKLRGERAPPFKRKYKSDYARGYQFGPHSVQGNPWSAPSFYPQQWGQVG